MSDETSDDLTQWRVLDLVSVIGATLRPRR